MWFRFDGNQIASVGALLLGQIDGQECTMMVTAMEIDVNYDDVIGGNHRKLVKIARIEHDRVGLCYTGQLDQNGHAINCVEGNYRDMTDVLGIIQSLTVA